ncbi:Abi family protein [Lacticaseibacillus jixiensis]|uniref:Abi family protein n=1 Tax=Lacticaseibacillus jixiensis TaxID=3231926 RepID=UPI0036F2E27B
MSYRRPAKNCSEQLEILKERGLQFDDRVAAEKLLSEIGYFRLKGYCLSFYKPNTEEFKSGVSMQQLYQVYLFDTAIRGITMKACQRAEVRFKSVMGMQLALMYGPVLPIDAFESPELFEKWAKNTDSAHLQGSKRKELYVRHYLEDYGEFPIWVDLELSTLGNVSKLFSWLEPSAKKAIADQYSARVVYLHNWTHMLTVVRNTCAHNSRFYGRFLPVYARIPKREYRYFGNSKYVSMVFVLSRLLDPADFQSYIDGLRHIIEDYYDYVQIGRLGFQQDWYRHAQQLL